jgi:type IV pilus assembly protein PilF
MGEGKRLTNVNFIVRCMRSGLLAASLVTPLLMVGCGSDPSASAGSRPSASAIMDRPFDPRASAKAHAELAAGYIELGNFAVALEEAKIAVDTDVSYAPGHSILGLVHLELRERGLAQQSFERALRLDDKDPDINHNYGWFLCQTGREREAVKFFMRAVENPLYPSPAKTYLTAGSCLQKVGDLKAASEYVDSALRIDANYAAALIVGARMDFARRNLTRARERIVRFNQVAAPTAESLWIALRIERLRGDRAAESNLGSQLRRRFPGSGELQAYERGQFE